MASKFASRPKIRQQPYRPTQLTLTQQRFARIQQCILSGQPCVAECLEEGTHDIDVLYSASSDLDRVNPMHEFHAVKEPEPEPVPEPEPEVGPEPEPEPIRPHSPEPDPRPESPSAPPPTPTLRRCRSMFDVLREARRKAIRDAVTASLPGPSPTV